MKAYALTVADQPAALVDLPDPELPADGVLIRVRAASVNGIDLFEANGYLVPMMPHDFPVVVGRDAAGVVDAVGPGRTDVAVGDEVIAFVPAMPPLRVGSWAEILAAGPEVALTPKPAGLSFEIAASIPLAGAAALDSVNAAAVSAGDTVLVIGATGGVGSIAVQLAAQRGATIIATARAGDDADFVRSLGASDTIDYSVVDVAAAVAARHPGGVDVLLDFVNRGDAFGPMASLVHDGGRIATTMGAADADALAARGIAATNVMGNPTPEKLADLAAQAAAGTLRIEVQQTFPLADAASALGAFAAGTRGKLVLTVE
jgi:NADPH:quinone reductase-like Zn-dependent oxidoreductase